MDAAGFILSIAFTLLKSRSRRRRKARGAVLILMSHGRLAVWSSALHDKLTGSAYTRHIG
jgi:hypothetical protein